MQKQEGNVSSSSGSGGTAAGAVISQSAGTPTDRPTG